MDCYTLDKRPVKLVFIEEFRSWPEAIEREVQVKRWSRKKKEALIKKDWESLKKLAKGKSKEKMGHGEPSRTMK